MLGTLQDIPWPVSINPSPQGPRQQDNDFDCGVFCMFTCNRLGSGLRPPFDFKQEDISLLRQLAAVECATHTLLEPC